MTRSVSPSFLRIELLSDATFSRGEGTAGVVDVEVEHDRFGIPFIGGRTLRGLLRDSWLSMHEQFPDLMPAAERVLGRSRTVEESCRLRVGDAVLPAGIRARIREAVERTERPLSPAQILAGFTSIRFQTAEDRRSGAPEVTTLRSSRVVLRGLAFDAGLTWLYGYLPTTDDLRLLALCALATRHGGLMRNRGRGHLRITLDGSIDTTRRCAEGGA